MPNLDRAEYVAIAVILIIIVGPLGLGRWMLSGITWRPPWTKREDADVPTETGPECKKCGARMESGARFCTACGAAGAP